MENFKNMHYFERYEFLNYKKTYACAYVQHDFKLYNTNIPFHISNQIFYCCAIFMPYFG